MSEKVAVLLDGGFVKKKLQEQLRRFPTSQDIVQMTQDVMDKPRLKGKELFRIFYYDAPPLEGSERNPIDGSLVNFSDSQPARKNRGLLDALELEPDFAVRRGALLCSGWQLGSAALKSLSAEPRSLTASDLVPRIEQKGVDLRIGLDIAWISLKRLVEVMVLVTGDSDFVPAMKFARREGLRVYLDTMGHPVRRELKAHSDFFF